MASLWFLPWAFPFIVYRELTSTQFPSNTLSLSSYYLSIMTIDILVFDEPESLSLL